MPDQSEKRFDRIEQKIDHVTQLVQTSTTKLAVIAHHQDVQGVRLIDLEEKRADDMEKTDARFKPLEQSMAMWAGIGRFVVIAIPIMGLLVAIGNFFLNMRKQ
jgi:hypothetical protein